MTWTDSRTAELQQSEDRLRLMIDAVPAMLSYLDPAERFMFCNQPYLRLLDKRNDEVLGRRLDEVLGAESYEQLQPHLHAVLAGQESRYERRHARHDGTVADLAVTFVPHLGTLRQVEGFFALTLDISELKTLQRKLAHMAQHDELTGQPNRALYADRLAQAMERFGRSGETFALLFVDVDHFKAVNDTQGHAAGDRLLCAFAARLRQCVRAIDTVARYGGDEFAVILAGPITQDHAALVTAKIVAGMRAPFDLPAGPTRVTASVGLALVRADDADTAALAARADAALYRAKAGGRDAFVAAE